MLIKFNKLFRFILKIMLLQRSVLSKILARSVEKFLSNRIQQYVNMRFLKKRFDRAIRLKKVNNNFKIIQYFILKFLAKFLVKYII